MADICYPPDTDWSATYPTEEAYDAARTAENEAAFEMAEMYAWSTLAALTNYRVGTCPITVRPCVQRALIGTSYLTAPVGRGNSGALGGLIGQFVPYMTGGHWVNGCGCRQSCECTTLPEVYVPGPVTKIVNVRVDGVILERSAYKIFDGNRLVRVDGGTWPLCQDLAAADDEGFSITYYRGVFPNAMVKYAAGVLANEYMLGFNGSEECRLPDNLTGMARSGESYTFQAADFPGGKTGIREVDMVVNIYNPHNLRAPVIVASADDYGPSVQTWGRRG